MRFDPDTLAFHGPNMRLAGLHPLLDGETPAASDPRVTATGNGWRIGWRLSNGATFALDVAPAEGVRGLELRCRLAGVPPSLEVDGFGFRIGGIEGVRAYLRSGYFSWDGSFYVAPGALSAPDADPKLATGYAMTQLLPERGEGGAVLGFLRHDRLQHRFRFAPAGSRLAIDVETLWDRIPHGGTLESEPLVLLTHEGVEEGLRAWARLLAAASPSPPRVPRERIAGWCSWYNLYAAIDEAVILEHLDAAAAARDAGLPLRVFQIDDGFTPEMGDWLDVKPQFPRGMAPLLADIRAKGLKPGLWIAPFLVGNRSRLHCEHPDWVVRERDSGAPLAAMTFYGEFRWHKRSEEYYVLDVTHPQAENYIRRVFRTWRRDWGCDYFKTDFLHVGSEYGPDRALWHRPGLTRIEVWMRMARLIREEIGDALWLGCGCPLFPPVGLLDAVRIGRDVGVTWRGERQSAQSLLRDQTARNFAHGILWQADPDCILLRDRFHHLTDAEVESLALFAGLAGGVLMTSDHLGELPPRRRDLLSFLLGDGATRICGFPLLGAGTDGLILQRVRMEPDAVIINAFNTADSALERIIPWPSLGFSRVAGVRDWQGRAIETRPDGLDLRLGPHQSRCFLVSGDTCGNRPDGAPRP